MGAPSRLPLTIIQQVVGRAVLSTVYVPRHLSHFEMIMTLNKQIKKRENETHANN